MAMTKPETKKYAAFRAGLILESILAAGWWPEEVEREHGAETVQALCDEVGEIAAQLVRRSGRRRLEDR